MHGLGAAPLAELIQFYLALNRFLVFMRIIILPLADGAAESD